MKRFFHKFTGPGYWGYSIGPWLNKALELQMSIWNNSPMFGLEWSYRTKHEDHQGLDIDLTIFHLELAFAFYDVRHAEYR